MFCEWKRIVWDTLVAPVRWINEAQRLLSRHSFPASDFEGLPASSRVLTSSFSQFEKISLLNCRANHFWRKLRCWKEELTESSGITGSARVFWTLLLFFLLVLFFWPIPVKSLLHTNELFWEKLYLVPWVKAPKLIPSACPLKTRSPTRIWWLFWW